jgi:hypothetical protein
MARALGSRCSFLGLGSFGEFATEGRTPVEPHGLGWLARCFSGSLGSFGKFPIWATMPD